MGRRSKKSPHPSAISPARYRVRICSSLGGQLPGYLTLCYRPELSLPLLGGEEDGADFLIHRIILTVPVHESPLCLLQKSLSEQGGADLIRIAGQLTPIQWDAVLVHIAVSVRLEQVGGHGRVQLQQLRLWRQDGEAVLTQYQIQAAAIVPLNKKISGIVNALQGSHGSRLDWVRIVPHFSELDPAPLGILLPQKVQLLFRNLPHSNSSHTHILVHKFAFLITDQLAVRFFLFCCSFG